MLITNLQPAVYGIPTMFFLDRNSRIGPIGLLSSPIPWAGMSHVTGTASDTGFAYVAGGGLDLDFFGFAIRLAQVDFHSADLFGQFQHQLRFSTVLIFRFEGFRDPAPPPPSKKPGCAEPPRQTGCAGVSLL